MVMSFTVMSLKDARVIKICKIYRIIEKYFYLEDMCPTPFGTILPQRWTSNNTAAVYGSLSLSASVGRRAEPTTLSSSAYNNIQQVNLLCIASCLSMSVNKRIRMILHNQSQIIVFCSSSQGTKLKFQRGRILKMSKLFQSLTFTILQ
jgi:hypothetical protein